MVMALSGLRRSCARIAMKVSRDSASSAAYRAVDSATAWSTASLKRIMSSKIAESISLAC